MAKPLGPSAYWGDEKIWDSKVNNHNSMFDKDGRVWMAAAVRGPKNPDFCKKGSDHPSAKLAPLEQSSRMLTIYDPKTQKAEFWAAPKTLEGADRARVWAELTVDRPFYLDYQSRTERELPLVKLVEVRPA